MIKFLAELTERTLSGLDITADEAKRLLGIETQPDIISLMSFANRIRHHYKGSSIDTCAIINARSGKCSEDCRFCSQSIHYNTDIDVYPLVHDDEIVARAREAVDFGAGRFGIVVSGKGVGNDAEKQSLCKAISGLHSKVGLEPCASLGVLSPESARLFREAGLKRYHHNLETAESFFPEICSTHSYEARINTIKIAKEEGFQVCCGGIFGIGESPAQRLEFAFTLKELDVDSIPLNFLNPIPGTPLEAAEPLHPMEILKTIALFRFVHPAKDIRICGGRQRNLRGTQGLAYIAGANAVMIGNYLTIPGSDPVLDLELIRDLMLEPV